MPRKTAALKNGMAMSETREMMMVSTRHSLKIGVVVVTVVANYLMEKNEVIKEASLFSLSMIVRNDGTSHALYPKSSK